MILAGGLASRFGGRPKGLEMVGGMRIIDRVASALGEASDELLLVANDPAAHSWLPTVRTVPDVFAGLGALGGLHAALQHAGTAVLVVAWDMPFVTGRLLAQLRSLGEGSEAALPWSAGPRGMEPLCAYYAPACLPAIERRLVAGERSAVSFHPDVQVTLLSEAEVRGLGDPDRLFLNVNTPEQLTATNRSGTTA